MSAYAMIALGWVAACLLVGLYIRGFKNDPGKQLRIGLAGILVSFILGAGILVVALLV